MKIWKCCAWKCCALIGFLAIIAVSFTFIACYNDGGETENTAHVHQWGNWQVTKAANCIQWGKETRVCLLDATHEETRPINPNPTAHIWGAWTQTKAPTTTAEGEETRTCTLIPTHKETRSVSLHIHQWGEWAEYRPPTCLWEGMEERTCAIDPSHKDYRIVSAALGHDWGEWTIISAPTCTYHGVERRTCTHDPSHTESRYVAEIGHDWGEWAQTTAPTCSTAGVETRRCIRDPSHAETRAGAPALGLDWGEWVVTKDPSETGIGEETITCLRDSSYTQTRTKFAYELGDTGPGGGKIFYRSAAGFTMGVRNGAPKICHYLEAAPSDLSGQYQWGTYGTDIANNTGTALGYGMYNTQIIISWLTSLGETNRAAQMCSNYTNNGYSDWFLPSKDELNELYKAMSYVGNLVTDRFYWSSSQYNKDNAWEQELNVQLYIYKNISNYVRPIRAF